MAYSLDFILVCLKPGGSSSKSDSLGNVNSSNWEHIVASAYTLPVLVAPSAVFAQ